MPPLASKKILLPVMAILLAALLAVMWWRHTKSLDYALSQIREAIEERDRLKLENLVDIDRFAEATVDAVVNEAALSSSDVDGWAILGSTIAQNYIAQIKPALRAQFRNALMRAVSSGRMDSLFAAASDSSEVDLALLPRATGTWVDEFEGVTDMESLGDVAVFGARFHQPGLDTTLTLRVRMERGDGRWRIVSPDNLGEYLGDLNELRDARLEIANDAVRRRIAEMVGVGELRRWTRSVGYYDDYLHLRAPLTNLTPDTISEVLIYLTQRGESIDDRAGMVITEPIPPGETGDAQLAVEYNRFIDWHTTLRFGDPDLELTYVATSADTVVEFGSWTEFLERGAGFD